MRHCHANRFSPLLPPSLFSHMSIAICDYNYSRVLSVQIYSDQVIICNVNCLLVNSILPIR